MGAPEAAPGLLCLENPPPQAHCDSVAISHVPDTAAAAAATAFGEPIATAHTQFAVGS